VPDLAKKSSIIRSGAEVLRAGKDGKAVKIQAITNGKYLLTQNQDGTAVVGIAVRRDVSVHFAVFRFTH
jgi:hypothetical protein